MYNIDHMYLSDIECIHDPNNHWSYWRGERAGNYVFRFLHHNYVGSISSYTTIHMVYLQQSSPPLYQGYQWYYTLYQHSVLCTHWGGHIPTIQWPITCETGSKHVTTGHFLDNSNVWLYSPIAQQCTHTHTVVYWVPQSWSATLSLLLWVLWARHQLRGNNQSQQQLSLRVIQCYSYSLLCVHAVVHICVDS